MLECTVFSPVKRFGSNCYVLKSDDEYCIIDPSVEYEAVKARLGDIANRVRYIILTHSHFDHILELDSWIDKTGVLPTVSEACRENLKDPRINCYYTLLGIDKGYFGKTHIVGEGDVLPFGDTQLSFILTPGHTNCSVSVICDGCIFVGDTIFSHGMYGRYDLPTSDVDSLRSSISRILSFDCDYKIMPGHSEPTDVVTARKYTYL